jgi:aldose 1-epimerase
MTDQTYTWNGKQMVMKKRGKTVELHGLVFDEPWHKDGPLQTSIAINEKTPMFEAFPFPCTLTLRYTIERHAVQVTYAVNNQGNEVLPFGFALHPYFPLLSGPDKTLLTVPASSWMEAPAETLLPTGRLINVEGKPYDLRTPVPVGALDLDHVFTDLAPGKYPEIHYTTLGFMLRLKASEEFTHVVVYTRDPGVVCVENQTCSTDAINLWNRGLKKESHLMTLAPGAMHTGCIRYEIHFL